jgi:thiol-disulfide isomerase/thioredoxin
MSSRALVGGFVVLTAGLIAFLVFQMSEVSKGRVKVGVKKAAACTPEKDSACLPDFELVDLNGTTWTRESLAGKAVLVNFWATWCAPCQRETPALVEVYQRYADQGLVVLGLHADGSVPAANVQSFIDSYRISYPVVTEMDRSVAGSFGYAGRLPTTFIYDRAGNLVFEQMREVSEAELERGIKDALTAAPAQPEAPDSNDPAELGRGP